MAKTKTDNTDNTIEIPVFLPGGITAEQLEKWKTLYGDVIQINIVVKQELKDLQGGVVQQGDIATCYLRPADRNVTAAAMSMFQKDQILECGEFALANCWLGGDERCKTDKKISIAAAVQAGHVVDILQGYTVKL